MVETDCYDHRKYNTWVCEDITFLFECSTRYLTTERILSEDFFEDFQKFSKYCLKVVCTNVSGHF